MVAKYQLTETSISAVGHINGISHTETLSCSQTHGLYVYRCYRKYANLWTRTSHAVNHVGIRIDISDGNSITTSIKAVQLPQKWSKACSQLNGNNGRLQ